MVRAQKRLAAELNKVERLYSMTRKGLKYRISFNGKPSKPVVIPWTAMSRGEETAEGVLIRFGHAEPKFFPNSCFLKPEDKATLLHMAYGKGLI
ncbi:MAG TPA: hypothetical protein VG944_09070 [Fimbriimonas sp.]|nr:hypothetical protein [Fimbriimonas sp.]